MWALIPVKRFCDAKSRLSNFYGPGQRADLARSLATTAIRAALGCNHVERVIVLSSDPEARLIALNLGAEAQPEARVGAGFNALIGAALDLLEQRGAQRLLYLASDLPELTASCIAKFSTAHAADVSIGRADRDGGTNALLFDAPRRFALAFGDDSARRHQLNAHAAGLTAQMLNIAGIANDLDTAPLALTGTL